MRWRSSGRSPVKGRRPTWSRFYASSRRLGAHFRLARLSDSRKPAHHLPQRSFILVGDSGEQDLELYVALARQYPANILAIYIRDVTTPFDPNAANPAHRHQHGRPQPGGASGVTGVTATAPAREMSMPPEVRWKHTGSMEDLAGLIDDDSVRFAAPDRNAASARTSLEGGRRPEEARTWSDMPDLPGQWDGSHERPPPARRLSDSSLPASPNSLSAPKESSSFPQAPASASPKPPRRPPHHAATGPAPATATSPPDSPHLLTDPDTDALSPNNPMRPSAPPAVPLVDPAVEAFYRRVALAEKGLPKGIVLRLFRHGNECGELGFSSAGRMCA